MFALDRFHTYVYGKRITVETDHKPLISIVKKALTSAPKRLQRMLLRLQSYDFELVYTPGSQLVIPDTLSRAYLTHPPERESAGLEELAMLADEEQAQELRLVASERTVAMIKSAAKADNQYQALKRQIRAGWPSKITELPLDIREYYTFSDELIISDDLVYKGQRVVLPREVRAYILERLHSSHIGVNGCIRRAHESVFYPGITRDIKELVGRCAICETYHRANQKETLLSHPAPSRPWEKVGVDIFTFHEQNYLITGDYMSGYFEIDRLPSKRVSDVIYCLKQQFARHGIPMEVFSDNNPFNASEFKAFAEQYEFKHSSSSPRYPQSNGRIENCVKTSKRLMTKAAEAKAILLWLCWNGVIPRRNN